MSSSSAAGRMVDDQGAAAALDSNAASSEERLAEARLEPADRALRFAGAPSGASLPVLELLGGHAVEGELCEERAVDLSVDEREDSFLLARHVPVEVHLEDRVHAPEPVSGARVDSDRDELVELADLLLERLLHALLELAVEERANTEECDGSGESDEDDVRGEDPRAHAPDGAVPVLALRRDGLDGLGRLRQRDRHAGTRSRRRPRLDRNRVPYLGCAGDGRHRRCAPRVRRARLTPATPTRVAAA